MNPAPAPIFRFTFPLPQVFWRHLVFGQTFSASSFIDWKISKPFLHLAHSYS